MFSDPPPRNPIILVKNAGFGETPIPADALVSLGDSLDIIDEKNGGKQAAKIIAIVPKGVPPEYAIADQAMPKEPRPLVVRSAFGQTAYIMQMGAEQLTVLQNKMKRGLTAANASKKKGKK